MRNCSRSTTYRVQPVHRLIVNLVYCLSIGHFICLLRVQFLELAIWIGSSGLDRGSNADFVREDMWEVMRVGTH